ncbi:MAG TPA: PAS domain S-box protein [Candidatus Binatia bacterium]|jgi:two-component system sensor kinase FixL
MSEDKTPTPADALRALRLQEARWQAILGTARDAIIGIDLTGRITLFNHAAEVIFGYAASEVMGQNVTILMPAPYREEHDAYLATYRATGVPKAIGRIREVEGRRKNGDVFPMELSVSEARVGDDVMYSAMIRDVTERRRAEHALAESEARHRAVLDTAASAIIGIDEGGKVLSFNPAAERLFGYAATEIVGQNVKLLMPVPFRHEHDGYLRHYLQTGERRVIGIGREVTGRRKDGTNFPMDLAVNDTLLDGRHFFTGVIRDLTHEKEAEDRERQLLKQALQNERLADIGAVTARIAHDFGNPLAGLQMTAQRLRQLLARDPVPVERLTQATDMIVQTVQRLDALVEEFKEFAREQRLHLRRLELPAFLQEIVTAWDQEATGRGIALEVDVGTDLPVIRADPDKLRRVMDNLVKNALEAVDRGPGVVRVTAELRKQERIRILVTDSGPGVPEGIDVFALFETTKAGGTGLGLAICKQIVLAHGGGIEYASHFGTGTVFRLELPAHGPTRRL